MSKKIFLLSLILVLTSFFSLATSARDDSSLVGHWKFDETEEGTSPDSSSCGNNGRIYKVKPSEGVDGTAFSFNGQDSYVEVPNEERLNPTQAITIEAWIRPNTWKNSYFNHVVGKKITPLGMEISYMLSGDFDTNRIRFILQCQGKERNLYGKEDIPIGIWSHIVATYDSNTEVASIYLNGELNSQERNASWGTIDKGEANLYIGALIPTYGFFDGSIDEVKIYNRALSEEEIKEHAHVKLNPEKPKEEVLLSYEFPKESKLPGKETESAGNILSLETLCQKIGFNPSLPGSFYFIQISDIHCSVNPPHDYIIIPGDSSIPWFTKEVGALEPKPAFVVPTGDLTDGGTADDYNLLHKLLTDFEQRLPNVPLKLVFGNHDPSSHLFLKLRPEQERHYYFDLGEIRFVVLFPYPSPEIDDYFGLGPEQIEWMKGLTESLPGKELVIFIHAAPTPPNWSTDPFAGNMLFDFKSALSKIKPEIKVWVIQGHWHGSRLSRLTGLTKENRPIYQVISPALCGSKSYRLFFIRKGEIIASALKDEDGSFSIDSPSDTWEEYQIFPPLPPEYSPLILINAPEDDKTYLVKEKNSIERLTYREIKGEGGFLVYHLKTIPPSADHLAMRILWRYLIDISTDGSVWNEVANSSESRKDDYFEDGGDGRLVIFPLPEEVIKEKGVFIRLRDPSPDGQYGRNTSMDWFSLLDSK